MALRRPPNPSFPSPTPSVSTLRNEADALTQANAKARSGGPSAVADRKAKRLDLEGDVDAFVAYVRATLKGQAVDLAAATAMILSTGLSVRKSARAPKPPLVVRHGAVSGEVTLAALSVAKLAMYFWEHSADEKTWTSAPPTLQTRTTISGLVPGQVYSFRFRAHTRAGMGDYADAVKLMVL